MLCGAAKANINPDLPIHLCGYRPDLLATGIHDDLFVTALFLDDGREKVALLTYDTLTIDAAFVEDVRAAGARETGLPPQALLTTVSHSHSTPMVRLNRTRGGAVAPQACPAWRERVVQRSAEALAAAVKNAEEVEISYNTARIRENLNRRIFFPDGTYYYQPKQKNLSALADGMVDDELLVVFFKRARREGYQAVLVNYTAHPLTVGDTSTLVSADFPGVLKREIEANLGLGCVAHFVNGACGDNHPLGAEAGFARAERMGLALAEKALYHRWDAVALDAPALASACREVFLPPLTQEQFDAIPPNFEHAYQPVREEFLAPAGIRTSFSLWSLGPLLFAGVPGEVTAEWGLQLKWSSPFPKTFVMFLATDHLGYIPHRNAYAWGGYEVLTSPLAPGAAEILSAAILAAAGDLKARVEARGGDLRLPAQRAVRAAPANAPGARS